MKCWTEPSFAHHGGPQILVNGGGEHAGGPLASLLTGLISSSMIKKGDGQVVPFTPAAE